MVFHIIFNFKQIFSEPSSSHELSVAGGLPIATVSKAWKRLLCDHAAPLVSQRTTEKLRLREQIQNSLVKEGTHTEDACGCLPDVILAINHAYEHQGQHPLQVTLKEAAAGGDSDDIRKRGKGGIGDLRQKPLLKKLADRCSACCRSQTMIGKCTSFWVARTHF
jgi:hypothetical protein